MDQDVYTRYYLEQMGNGLSGIGTLYRRRRYYQSGRGIGSLFSGIMKSLRPIFKSTVKAVGKQSLKTGKNIFKSIGKQSFKDSLKENGQRMLSALAEKGVEQIEKINSMNNVKDLNQMEGQEGSGTSLSFTFKNKKKGFKRKAKSSSAQYSKGAKRVRKTKKQGNKDIFS